MEELSSAPLERVMPSAQAFLQHPATHLAAVTALVERLPLESPAGVRSILRALCYAGACGPPVSDQLLEMFPLLESELAVELLAFLPQLMGEGEAQMQQLLAVCKEVMAADRTLMLPVIGALGQAPLTDALKHDLARLALGALPLAEESDLPTLVRALMQSLTAASMGRVLRGLRAQLGAVRPETLALLLQVVCNRLRVNGSAVRALLRLCEVSPNPNPNPNPSPNPYPNLNPNPNRNPNPNPNHDQVSRWRRPPARCVARHANPTPPHP